MSIKKSKQLILTALISLLATSSVYAQYGKITSRKECNRRCNISFNKPEISLELFKLIEKFRVAKLKLSAPENLKELKELEKLEQVELEKYRKKSENTCQEICADNPE